MEGQEEHYENPADAGETIQASSFSLGVASGWADAKDLLLEAAGKAYSQKQDERARLLREFADLLDVEYKEKRAYYDKKTRPAERAAFEYLDRCSPPLSTTKDE